MDDALNNMNDDVDLGDMENQVIQYFILRLIILFWIWKNKQLVHKRIYLSNKCNNNKSNNSNNKKKMILIKSYKPYDKNYFKTNSKFGFLIFYNF